MHGTPVYLNCLQNISSPNATLTASGTHIKWYSDSTLINLVGTGNTFTTTNQPGIYKFYVTQTVNGCESNFTISTLTINQSLTTTVNYSICSYENYFAGGAYQTTTGIYYDSLHTTNGCDSIIITNLTVNPTLITPIIYQNGDTLYSLTQIGNQWYNQNGIILNATNGTFFPIESGNYFVILSENNCKSDSSNIISVIIDGIEQKEVNEILIYPNPIKNKLNVELVNNELFYMELTNLLGKSIYSKFSNQKITLDMSNYSNGVYLLILSTNKFKIIKLIIKQ